MGTDSQGAEHSHHHKESPMLLFLSHTHFPSKATPSLTTSHHEVVSISIHLTFQERYVSRIIQDTTFEDFFTTLHNYLVIYLVCFIYLFLIYQYLFISVY